jgi:uncharacterized protein YndB with AHSA1/START domain
MTEPVVRTSVRVEVPIERAFRVFTEGFDTWWPRSHHIGSAEMVEGTIEPRLDGRWFERDADGQECDWGRVLAWDPPRHVALSWHLNVDFDYDPDPAKASRVDVHFVAAGDRATLVELVHSELDRHGPDWPKLAESVSSGGGWPGLLQDYAERAS